jgi:hypothetical protein
VDDGILLHALKSHPYVGLDVLHDVSDVEWTIGVRQRGRNEEGAVGHTTKTFVAEGESCILAARSHDEYRAARFFVRL